MLFAKLLVIEPIINPLFYSALASSSKIWFIIILFDAI
jgi:hypothetical protein